MKKVLFIYFLLYSSFILAQQAAFYSQPAHSSEIFKVIPLPNKQYAYLGKTHGLTNTSWGREQFFVGILDSNLRQIKYFGQGILPNAERLTPLTFGVVNNKLYITYFWGLCDILGGSAAMFYINYENGNNHKGYWGENEINDVIQTQSGYMLAEKAAIANNFQLFDNEHNLDNISLALQADEKPSLLFAGKNHFYFSTSKNRFISVNEKGKDLKVLGSFNPHKFFIPSGGEEIVPNEKIIYRMLDTLYLADFQKNVFKKYKIKDFNVEYKFEETNKEIMICEEGKVSVFDINFNLIRIEQNGEIKINGFLNVKDSIYFYGSEEHLPQSMFRFFSSQIATFKPYKKDERKLNLTIEGIEFAINPPIIQQTGPSGNSTVVQFGTITVTLRNMGTDTIKSFNLNGWHDQNSFICPGAFHQTWEFPTSKVLPNQTIKVSLPNVVVSNIKKNKDDEFCLWVSLINDQPDKNLGNNQFCKPFENLVSTQNLDVEFDGVSVFPNPANSTLQIKSLDDESIQNIELIDMSGRVVLSQSFDNQNIVNLNVAEFNQAFYILKIRQADKTKVVRLLIKE